MTSEETIPDITREMRDLAARHTFGQEVDDALAAIPIDDYADRLDAAAERMRDSYCEVIHEKDAAYDRLLVERDRAIQAAAPGNADAHNASIKEQKEEQTK